MLLDGARSVELARLIALACLGKRFIASALPAITSLVNSGGPALQVDAIAELHPPRDCAAGRSGMVALPVVLQPDGNVVELKRGSIDRSWPDLRVSHGGVVGGIRQRLAFAYGPSWLPAEPGEDGFDFDDLSRLRARRFLTVFDPAARLSDPSAFLQRLSYRVRKARKPAVLVLRRFVQLIETHLEVDARGWLEQGADFTVLWGALPDVQARILLPLVDMVRHVLDATPHDLDPLARPCVVVVVHPERACPGRLLPEWLSTLGQLLPAAQVVAVLPESALDSMPHGWRDQRLPMAVDVPAGKASRHAPSRRTPGPSSHKRVALLVDVDGRIPNLALMKLAMWLRRQRREVLLVRRDGWRHLVETTDHVYASCVFNHSASQRRVAELRHCFRERLSVGGSGVDIEQRLPPEIEALSPDLSLYPELADRSIGFLTRGCPRRCHFCIVPRKEGAPRQVADVVEVLQCRDKLVLLDDNILAHSRADALLAELAERGVQVNFNQTLDITLVDRDRAALLRRIHCSNYAFTRTCHHFSLNDVRHLEDIRQRYGYFGFKPRENVEFVCMYGFSTNLAEDVERFRFIRSLPGAYVFMQEYSRPLGGPEPQLDAFFEDRPDALIDELVRILFPQNMKSMERYYRWLSLRYLETFGTLHQKLVDTIFRYNRRDQKGLYVTRMLAGRGREACAKTPPLR